jgi:hypothetical protein
VLRKLFVCWGMSPCFRGLISRVNAATVWLGLKKVKKMKIKHDKILIIVLKQ